MPRVPTPLGSRATSTTPTADLGSSDSVNNGHVHAPTNLASSDETSFEPSMEPFDVTGNTAGPSDGEEGGSASLEDMLTNTNGFNIVGKSSGPSAEQSVEHQLQKPEQRKQSTYEAEREANQERNKRMLMELGIDVFQDELFAGIRNPGKLKKTPIRQPAKKKKKRTSNGSRKPADQTSSLAKARDAKARKRARGDKKNTEAPSAHNTPEDEPMQSENEGRDEPDANDNQKQQLPSIPPAQSQTSPSNAPTTSSVADYLIAGRIAMDGIFDSSEHQQMLDDWIDFEYAMGPQDPKKTKLSKRARPQQVADWLDRQPGYTVAPPIGKPLDYGMSWCTWWRSMQPRWRREGDMLGDLKLARDEAVAEDWVNLSKAGYHGMFLVLLSLSWWLAAAKEESDRRWCMEAIDDVAWVLKQLLHRLRRVDVDEVENEGAQRGNKRYSTIDLITSQF